MGIDTLPRRGVGGLPDGAFVVTPAKAQNETMADRLQWFMNHQVSDELRQEFELVLTQVLIDFAKTGRVPEYKTSNT